MSYFIWDEAREGIKREYGFLSLLQFVYDSVSGISLLHLQYDL